MVVHIVYGAIALAAAVGVHSYVGITTLINRNKRVPPTTGTGPTGDNGCSQDDNVSDGCVSLSKKQRDTMLFLGITAWVALGVIIALGVMAIFKTHRHNTRRVINKKMTHEEHHEKHTGVTAWWMLMIFFMLISSSLVLGAGVYMSELFPQEQFFRQESRDIAIAGGVYLVVTLALGILIVITNYNGRILKIKKKDKRQMIEMSNIPSMTQQTKVMKEIRSEVSSDADKKIFEDIKKLLTDSKQERKTMIEQIKGLTDKLSNVQQQTMLNDKMLSFLSQQK
jgi:NADH:ubiquinone oxidoreductase subunit 5 (subunit L)/multisubunit Na+/H+ antiporter MnhA subunit